MKIVLISCASKKLPYKAQAKDLYVSPLFKLNFKYAKSLKPDKIFILSAKHGLIDLGKKIEPYNQTLNNMSFKEVEGWARRVMGDLREISNLKIDEIVFLAGEKYRKYLIPHIKNYKVPLKGLSIGKQLKFLKEKNQNSELCGELHKLFNSAERLTFPFNEEKIPLDGIYILFEKGEKAHDGDRIVRIGSHTGKDQLRSRLNQHFINENKDRSIFRKNIGRALLNRQKDSYLKIWELDLTTRDSREKFGELIDAGKQKEIEKKVTKHLQDNFSFIIFPMGDQKERLEFESKLISTVSLCQKCRVSKNWLGSSSPKQKIREGGLWLVNELYKEPLSKDDFKKLKNLLKGK